MIINGNCCISVMECNVTKGDDKPDSRNLCPIAANGTMSVCAPVCQTNEDCNEEGKLCCSAPCGMMCMDGSKYD